MFSVEKGTPAWKRYTTPGCDNYQVCVIQDFCRRHHGDQRPVMMIICCAQAGDNLIWSRREWKGNAEVTFSHFKREEIKWKKNRILNNLIWFQFTWSCGVILVSVLLIIENYFSRNFANWGIILSPQELFLWWCIYISIQEGEGCKTWPFVESGRFFLLILETPCSSVGLSITPSVGRPFFCPLFRPFNFYPI